MALREAEWRGHKQWVCDEHHFDTLKETAALEHVAEFHADEAEQAAGLASLTAPTAETPPATALPAEKKGK